MALDNTLEAFKTSGLALVLDDSTDLGRSVIVAPCKGISADVVNRALHLTGGHVFAAISAQKADAFRLLPMSRSADKGSNASRGMSACVSVEARTGVSTGISAHDRARTLSVLGTADPHPKDLVMPGHIFPMIVKNGGVLVKHALLEGAYDLTHICFDTDGALVMDMLDTSGSFLEPDKLLTLAEKEELPVAKLSDIVQHRLLHEQLVRRVAEAKLPSRFAGDLTSIVYKSELHDGEHIALVKGDISTGAVLTRVQPERTISDVFGGSAPSKDMIENALAAIGKHGSGVLVYLRSPVGGELSKELGSDRFGSDAKSKKAIMREYGLGAQILRDLGIKEIDLMTGSKKDLVGLSPFGIQIVSQRPIPS